MSDFIDSINNFELLNDLYTKKIYFLGIAYGDNNKKPFSEDTIITECKQFFFRSHGLVYCMKIDLEKIDTGFDKYISDVKTEMFKFKNPKEFFDFAKSLKGMQFLRPYNSAQINLEKTDTRIFCDFFEIFFPNTGIFSDIFIINKDNVLKCNLEEFINYVLSSSYSLEDTIKFYKDIKEDMDKNKKYIPNRIEKNIII